MIVEEDGMDMDRDSGLSCYIKQRGKFYFLFMGR